MTQSEQIFKWLEDNRDFFKPEGICKELKIDKGNFSKYKAAKSIPEKYIKPIIDILFRFGFIYGKIPLEEFKPLSFGGYKLPIKKVVGLGNKAIFVSPPKDAYDSPKMAMIVNDEMGQWVEPKLTADQIKRIGAIRAEKLPEHRNTRFGKKSWQQEQDARVLAIQNGKGE